MERHLVAEWMSLGKDSASDGALEFINQLDPLDCFRKANSTDCVFYLFGWMCEIENRERAISNGRGNVGFESIVAKSRVRVDSS